LQCRQLSIDFREQLPNLGWMSPGGGTEVGNESATTEHLSACVILKPSVEERPSTEQARVEQLPRGLLAASEEVESFLRVLDYLGEALSGGLRFAMRERGQGLVDVVPEAVEWVSFLLALLIRGVCPHQIGCRATGGQRLTIELCGSEFTEQRLRRPWVSFLG